MSRTHLRQQLMKEQVEEEERRARDDRWRGQIQQPHQSQQTGSVPTHLMRTLSHQHPMKMQGGSRLENPTNYHLIHSLPSNGSLQANEHQQRQLSPISRTSPSVAHQPFGSHPPFSHLQSQSPFPLSPESPLSAPPSSTSEFEDVWDDLNKTLGLDVNEVINEHNVAATVPSDLPMFARTSIPNDISSPIEESQQSNLSDDNSLILSNSCPPLSEAEKQAWHKERLKKDNHNKIERKRRYNINDRIKELGTLLPANDDSRYYEMVRDMKQNKGTILKASVDYMKCLKNDVAKMNELERKIRDLELENRQMKVLKEENQRIKCQLLESPHMNSPVTDTPMHADQTQSMNYHTNWLQSDMSIHEQASEMHQNDMKTHNSVPAGLFLASSENPHDVPTMGEHDIFATSQFPTLIKREHSDPPSQNSSGLGSMSSPSPVTLVPTYIPLSGMMMQTKEPEMNNIKNELFSSHEMDICN